MTKADQAVSGLKIGYDKTEVLGCQLARGYLYWCRPASAAAYDRSDGRRYGYHGTDLPPCAAEYLCDDEPGYLVISDSPELPKCVEGWACERADELDTGSTYSDGTWTVTIVRAHGRGEYTTCGYC